MEWWIILLIVLAVLVVLAAFVAGHFDGPKSYGMRW